MLIGITAAIVIAVAFGAFIVVFAAAAMARRSVELDCGLEERPIEQWSMSGTASGLNAPTQLRLS